MSYTDVACSCRGEGTVRGRAVEHSTQVLQLRGLKVRAHGRKGNCNTGATDLHVGVEALVGNQY